jgi:lipoyl(octanoyl) transferase
VVWYVRQLEEAMIRATAAFGVAAVRFPGCTGAWIVPKAGDGGSGQREKLGAIGVHISRWVTSHGFAYNVSTDLRYFDLIVPCGIAGCGTTSLEALLGRPVALDAFAAELVTAFGDVFGLEMASTARCELLRQLDASELAAAPAAR